MLSKTSRIPSAPALRPLMVSRTSAQASRLPEPADQRPGAKKLGGLVLTRHLGESIMVGEDVEVQVVGVKSGTVRLKIMAPRTVPVHRREVFEAIQADPAAMEAARSRPETAPRPGKPQGGLVLTRSVEQSIMIGDEVELMVVEVRPTTVKIKISAPKSIAVHRREVFEAIREGRA